MTAQLKQKTHKVLDMEVDGYRLICIFHYDQKGNPYHLYLKWYEGGWKMKQLVRYQDFASVICHVKDWMFENKLGFRDWLR